MYYHSNKKKDVEADLSAYKITDYNGFEMILLHIQIPSLKTRLADEMNHDRNIYLGMSIDLAYSF